MNFSLPPKPHLRGWQHLIMAPLSLIAGVVLLIISPADLRIPVAIYVVSTVALFTISATYHRVNWRPSVRVWMQRIDHSAIFLLIAGSYTAVTFAIIGGQFAVVVSAIAWIAAAIGITLRLLWHGAPKWLFVPCYLVFGVSGALFAPVVLERGGAWALTLVVTGGVFYVVGAVIFASQFPNPSQKWFGFHEVFHSFTLGGYMAHYAAVAMGVVTLGSRALT